MPLFESGKATHVDKHLVTFIPNHPENSAVVETSEMYSNSLSLKNKERKLVGTSAVQWYFGQGRRTVKLKGKLDNNKNLLMY